MFITELIKESYTFILEARAGDINITIPGKVKGNISGVTQLYTVYKLDLDQFHFVASQGIYLSKIT